MVFARDINFEPPRPQMGPDAGTPDYKRQVEMITNQLRGVPMLESELDQFLCIYVMDRTIARAAICEAEKLIQKERGWR